MTDVMPTTSSSEQLSKPSSRSHQRTIFSFIWSVIVFFLFSLALLPREYYDIASIKSRTSRCPDPFTAQELPINEAISGVDTWFSERQQLDSRNSDFRISLSRSITRPCNVFAIDVLRSDQEHCKSMETRSNMSHDPEVLRYIKDELGPDTFMLRVSGGQRWTSELPRYLGNCSWRFDVRLSNGGDIWLELWHSYTDYQAFDEDDPSDWINYTRTALLDQPLQINLCPLRCKSHPFPRHNLWLLQDIVNDRHPTLPPCGDTTLTGVWLPWHPADRMYPPAFIIPPRKGFSPLMGQFHFLPNNCHLYHAGNQFLQDHSACTVRKNGEKWNVLFLGDSHMRFVLHSWQYRLAGHTDYYPEKEKPEWKKNVVTYNDSSYYFNWSPYAKDWHTAVQAEDLENIDAIVASYAAWPAMNGITAAEYTAHLIHGLDVIDQHATSRLKRKVWLTSAPFPPWTKPDRKERRTNAQLAYWNRVTKRIVQERGWLIVDQFELGMPLVLEIASGDGVHLSPSDAHAVIVDDVLAKTGICVI